MRQLHPATISVPLLRDIAALMKIDEPVDAVTVAGLRRDADKLMAANRAEGHLAKSGVAALTWDVLEAQKQVDLAVMHDGSPRMLNNALVTFDFLNRPDLAVDFARRIINLAPFDPKSIDSASGYLMTIGLFAEAAAAQTRCSTIYPDYVYELNAVQMAGSVAYAGVDEDWMMAELCAAREVLSDFKIRMREVVICADEDPDGSIGIIFDLKFHGSLAKEFELERELASKLSDTEKWDPCLLSVNLSYLSADASNSF